MHHGGEMVSGKPRNAKWHWISVIAIVFFAILIFIIMVMRNFAAFVQQESQVISTGEFTVAQGLERPALEVTGPQKQVQLGDHAAIGAQDPKVTIVEFGDFQCPFCKKSFPILKAVLAKYSDDVQLQYRHFPVPQLHSEAPMAAVASECARDQDRFWEYHDALFQNQNVITEPNLIEFAKTLNLDTAVFSACLDDDAKKDKVRQDVEDGLDAGVVGTPTFFINGFRIQGDIPFEGWEDILNRVM